jgi:hypothetical protein
MLTSRCHTRCHSVEAEKPQDLCEGKGGGGKKHTAGVPLSMDMATHFDLKLGRFSQ